MQHVTWATALEAYIERLDKRGTAPDYQGDAAKIVLDFERHCTANLRAVQGAHVETWLDCWTAQHTRNGANHRRRVLHAFFAWARRRHYISHNPVDDVEPYRIERRLRRNLTWQEYGRVVRCAKPALADLLDWLLLTGCRIGEAMAMMPADCAGEPKCWTIPRRKGHDQLRIPLGPDLLAILSRRPGSPVRLPPQPVWRWEWSLTGLQEAIDAACVAAGVPHFSPHDLRHAAASWAQSGGVPATAIQALLGHADPQTTAIYMHGDGTQLVAFGQQVLATMLRQAKISAAIPVVSSPEK